MKVCAAVLTYKAIEHDRVGLLEQTVASLDEADEVFVVDNGSGAPSADLIRDWGGYVHPGSLHTSGHGTNLCARILAGTDADVCVLSDDDMVWRPGWRNQLEAWWTEAPDDLALTGCHIEPEFPWNEIHGHIRLAGIPGLLRASTGAASWSYRAHHYEPIFGPAGIPQQVQGHGDVPACDRLVRERGYRLAQIDLADHAGHDRSTWGNVTIDKYGWDDAPVRRLLETVPA